MGRRRPDKRSSAMLMVRSTGSAPSCDVGRVGCVFLPSRSSSATTSILSWCRWVGIASMEDYGCIASQRRPARCPRLGSRPCDPEADRLGDEEESALRDHLLAIQPQIVKPET